MPCAIAPERLVNLATLKMMAPDLGKKGGRVPYKSLDPVAQGRTRRSAKNHGHEHVPLAETTNEDLAALTAKRAIIEESREVVKPNGVDAVRKQELSQKIIDL